MKGLHLLVAIFEQLCDKYSINGNYLICSMAYISADDGGDIPKPNRLLGGLIPGRENFPLLGGTSVARLSCPSSLPQKEVYMSELESTAIVKTLSPLKTHFDMTSGFNMSLCSKFPMQRMTKVLSLQIRVSKVEFSTSTHQGSCNLRFNFTGSYFTNTTCLGR